MPKIISICCIEDYKLKAEFINGEVKVYDFFPQLDFHLTMVSLCG